MINYKRIILIFLAVLVVLGSSYLYLENALANGLTAGFLTGVINFYVITFTVKWLLSDKEGAPAGKAALSVLVFLGKIILFSALIAGLVIYRKYYSIFGFLGGFTASMAVIGIENLIAGRDTK